MDSDSDDELMNRLASGVFGRVAVHHENCAYCATANATLPCTTCQAAYYCSELCKRRHFAAHRAFCITARMQHEESEEEESSEEESEEEVEEVRGSFRRGSSSAQRRSSARGSMAFGGGGGEAGAAGHAGGVQVPGLTPKQVKKLLELSAKAESMTSSKAIEELQQQLSTLMAQRQAEVAERASEASNKAAALQRAGSTLSDVKLNEIKELQKKLVELEKKTQTIEFTTRNSSAGGSTVRASKPIVYTPLLVKDDEAFRKYFKLKDMSMPIEQIKAKMVADGINSDLLDTPDDVSPNDPGPPEGAYIPMLTKDDPTLKKYFKLKSMNMPLDQIKLKMEADGVDPNLLDHPGKVSPNDPGPPLYVEPIPFHDHHGARMSMPAMGFDSAGSPSSAMYRMSMPAMSMTLPPPASPASAVPYMPMLVKDDPELKKFFKLQQMGMPVEQIKLKMSAEGLDPNLLDRRDDVSPKDPGPPATPPSPSGPMSMEQLFSILMQHQQIIQQVSSGNGSFGGAGGRTSSSSAGDMSAPPRSVEDQMAKELAAAESAIDDIFGEEQQQSKGMGGMNMIEQLEKKARKESNKKLVENREEVNRLIKEVLNANLATDEEAIKFYNDVCPKLEHFGLGLGVDSVQTWSARLLIKNKDTRDWYFSEQERLDAGNAYGRLWSMSFLDRDAGQLIAKRTQILNAPNTLRASVKNKVELIDKFTQLLKDTVKLKHKIFKGALYASELRRLHENRIPERFEERGNELIESSTVLADAAMDLAEEDFRVLDNTTRAKKIRALTAIHVAEKAIQLVTIVKKLGATGVNGSRLAAVEAKTQALKEEYMTGEQEQEEEDDVL